MAPDPVLLGRDPSLPAPAPGPLLPDPSPKGGQNSNHVNPREVAIEIFVDQRAKLQSRGATRGLD